MNEDDLKRRYVAAIEESDAVYPDPEAEAERQLNRLLYRPLDTIDNLLARRYAKRFDIADPDQPESELVQRIAEVRGLVHG